MVTLADHAVAVLVNTPVSRYVVLTEHIDNGWAAPEMLFGVAITPLRREAETIPHRPLTKPSTSRVRSTDGKLWYALTGTAAKDAVKVDIASQQDSMSVPVGANGRVFAVVQIRRGEKPTVVVHTSNGRALRVPDVWL
jgi:hypothetical protein